AGVADVCHRPLLLGLLERIQEVGDQQRCDDADDGHDDEKLDQGEALLPVPDPAQHGISPLPRFRGPAWRIGVWRRSSMSFGGEESRTHARAAAMPGRLYS